MLAIFLSVHTVGSIILPPGVNPIAVNIYININMVTLPSWPVSTNFGTWSYHCLLSNSPLPHFHAYVTAQFSTHCIMSLYVLFFCQHWALLLLLLLLSLSSSSSSPPPPPPPSSSWSSTSLNKRKCSGLCWRWSADHLGTCTSLTKRCVSDVTMCHFRLDS